MRLYNAFLLTPLRVELIVLLDVLLASGVGPFIK